MEVDPVRDERQDTAIQHWKEGKGVGTLQATTGFGKTRVALKLIKKFKERNPDARVIVVVPTTFLRNQWGGHIKEWGFKNVSVWIINSLALKDGISLECDLLILDEIHVYTAEKFSRVFERVSYRFILGLTAEINTQDEKYDIIKKKAPIIDTVTLKECLDNGWVANFIIYNLGLELDEEDKEEYKKLNKAFQKFFAIFGRDLDVVFRVINDSRYRKKYARSIHRDPGSVIGIARKFIAVMNQRKAFLHANNVKIRAAKQIVEKFPDRKIITFAQTVKAVDKVSAGIGDIAVPYHSQIKGQNIHGEYYGAKRMRELNIERFRHGIGGVRVLCAAKALDMGMDLPDIDMGLILSGTSKSLQDLQRRGRIIRSKDRRAIIVEIYIKSSQDKRWLRSRQKKVPRKLIKWIDSVEEIAD